MLKTYLKFINENKEPEITVHISQILLNKLNKLNNNSFVKSILNTQYLKSNLRNKYADYLDYNDKDGTITYLITDTTNPKYTSNPYTSRERKSVKATKILNFILIDTNVEKINQRDIDLFSIEMKPKLDVVEIWKGEDILKAYNYTNLIDMSKFSSTCANFNQNLYKKLGRPSWEEPKKNWYDVYIENPENISVIVVVNSDGQVKGRRMLFTGEQFEDSVQYKKGEYYGMAGNYYGIGGEYSTFDNMILDWVKNNNYETFQSKTKMGNFMIQLKNYKYPAFPPFDGFYINLKNGVISYPYKPSTRNGETWYSCYKLVQNK